MELVTGQPEISPRTIQNLTTVIDRSTAPFTTAEILDHAIGFGGIRHADEIEPILRRLVDLGVIEHIDAGAQLWASTRAAHRVEVAASIRDAPATVLIVDDNPANQQLAQLMLEHLGYQPDIASSGDQAVEMVASHQYSAVLMDCQMPGTDGFEATRQIRSAHLSSSLPVIAFTTNTTVADRQRCIDAGMTDVLAKPAQPAVLDQMLQRWIHNQALHAESTK